ncbi:MAG: zf-HC2 domain-containing protein [Anaerolineae bacterium]|nr:zf-HC2 domain-containing protein [Anaerolineae bacterium]
MSEHIHSSNCRHLLGSLSEYIDGELEARLCAELEEHLEGCEDCRVVVNTLRKTVELYHKTEAADESLPNAVRERLFYKLNLEDHLKHP